MDFAISRPAVGKVRWRHNSCAGFTCALRIWTLPFGQGLTAQAHGLPPGLPRGPAWRSPAGLIQHGLKGNVRWSECLPTLGTVRPKPPVFEVPLLPAVLPQRDIPREITLTLCRSDFTCGAGTMECR